MNAASVISISGFAICSMVLLQMVMFVLHSIHGIVGDRRRFRSTQELLKSKIIAAKRGVTYSATERNSWEGFRKFRVKWKVAESDGCHSFYLVPHDGKPLPVFRPGQYLTFSFKLSGESRPVIRCYSLSDSPRQDYYRISVKKVPPPREGNHPPGRISTYLNDELQEGEIIDVKSPRGAFYLDLESSHPVVLIAAGIGITPLLSMLNYVVESDSRREVYFFMCAQNVPQHPFRKHLARIAEQHPNVHLYTLYSNPLPGETKGVDFDFEGYLTLDLLRKILPSNNFNFYLCGPPPFMAGVTGTLEEWGVPASSVKSEAFGPASVKSTAKPAESIEPSASTKGGQIQFAKSSKMVDWVGDHESILELAEAAGVNIDSGCRAGNCGTCLTAIKSGSVDHSCDVEGIVEEGSCLPCVATPNGKVILDA